MKNLVKMMAVMTVVVVMVFAFTGCGSQPDFAGAYVVDDGWTNEYGGYTQCFTQEEAFTLAHYYGIDEITFTDEAVYLANGETYAISEVDYSDEHCTIYCSNGYEFTYYFEDATVAFNCAHYDFWYNPVNK